MVESFELLGKVGSEFVDHLAARVVGEDKENSAKGVLKKGR